MSVKLKKVKANVSHSPEEETLRAGAALASGQKKGAFGKPSLVARADPKCRALRTDHRLAYPLLTAFIAQVKTELSAAMQGEERWLVDETTGQRIDELAALLAEIEAGAAGQPIEGLFETCALVAGIGTAELCQSLLEQAGAEDEGRQSRSQSQSQRPQSKGEETKKSA